MQLIGIFIRDLERQLEGTPDEGGLLQSIHPMQVKFKKSIRNTAPEFKPFERKFASAKSLPKPDFLDNEEESSDIMPTSDNSIYVDEVFTRAATYTFLPPFRTFFCLCRSFLQGSHSRASGQLPLHCPRSLHIRNQTEMARTCRSTFPRNSRRPHWLCEGTHQETLWRLWTRRPTPARLASIILKKMFP